MKKLLIALLMVLGIVCKTKAQIFEVDTLQYLGDTDKYINFVLLGDGYMASEQTDFIRDATKISNHLFSTSPWSNYKEYFNVFAIKVVSKESGAKHPLTASDCNMGIPSPIPTSNPDNYLGSTFDAFGIHRLLVADNSKVFEVLSTNLPMYDQALVIVNSSQYGGSGGTFPTTSMADNSQEIAFHELGHSFANLADEYYAGDGYAREAINMTMTRDTSFVKWKNWLGTNDVGVFQHCCGGNSSQWYKPHRSCKMEVLNSEFCAVCKEGIIERIHSMTNNYTVVNYTPASGTIHSSDQYIDFKLLKLMKPTPNTLKIEWRLDGTLLGENTDSIKLDQSLLKNGRHKVSVTIIDTTSLLRVNNHHSSHVSAITWTIEKAVTGTYIKDAKDNFKTSVYPNPSSNILNFSFELSRKSEVNIEILNSDGKFVMDISNKSFDAGLTQKSIDIKDLPIGRYLIVFTIEGARTAEVIIKD